MRLAYPDYSPVPFLKPNSTLQLTVFISLFAVPVSLNISENSPRVCIAAAEPNIVLFILHRWFNMSPYQLRLRIRLYVCVQLLHVNCDGL